MIDVEAIRKLCEAATAGPWDVDAPGDGDVYDCTLRKFVCHVGRHPVDGNEQFIAAARTLVPQLLEAYERMREARDELGCLAEEYLLGRNTVVTAEREERIARLRRVGAQ